MSYLGGISGLLDDLFDEPGKSADHLEDFILDPESLLPENTHEKLLKHLYLKGLSCSPHPEKIKQIAREVFKAQQESLAQKEFTFEERISDLTFLKGGNSFKYYRLCLFHPLIEKEEIMVFQLGGLMQLGNDIFDVWKDSQEGILTVGTTSTSIHMLRENFVRELEKTHSLASALNYRPPHKQKFQRTINLAIARVFVCLDQFENLQSSNGKTFLVTNYSRKQLICDMQKPVNQIKAIHYYLRSPVKKMILDF